MKMSKVGLRWHANPTNPFALDVHRMLSEPARENLRVPLRPVETYRIGTRAEAEAGLFPPYAIWWEYVPNPNVGAELDWLNTYYGVIKPVFIKFNFTASAAVGTRLPVLVFTDGGGSPLWALTDIAVSGGISGGASELVQYYNSGHSTTQMIGSGVAPIYLDDGWLPEIYLTQGMRIRTSFASTLDVADQISNVQFCLELKAV
jgi:hypothetical protein